MRFLPYILRHLRRSWLRSGSTMLAIGLCIFLFCTLQTFVGAVTWNLRSANASRLVTRHAVSLVFSLPPSYGPRIAALPGVRRVAMVNWFGGTRRPGDFTDFFPNFAVDAEPYLEMYPEYMIPDDQKRAFLQDRRGCVIGRRTADAFGWSIGDTFQLQSFIPPYRAERPFEFVVRAIYDTDEARYPGTLGTLMLFHYQYLDEMTGRRAGVGTYVAAIDDPASAGAIAGAIDGLFANSDAETRTMTEAAFRASFVSLAGNLALLLNGIALAVAFTILLVTANTMSMAFRERRTEIAVLKTLGYPGGLVLGLVLGESACLGAGGGIGGIALGGLMIRRLQDLPFIGDAVRGFPGLGLSVTIAAAGFGVALLIGLAAGLVPAVLAYRARVTDILRIV